MLGYRLRLLLCFVITAAVVLQAPELGDGPTLAKPAVERDRYGIEKERYHHFTHEIQKNETLSSILRTFGVTHTQINQVSSAGAGLVNFQSLRVGSELLAYTNAAGVTPLFVYRTTPGEYALFDFRDTVAVYVGQLQEKVTTKTVRGSISQSLYRSLDEAGADEATGGLTSTLERILPISFYSLQPNDSFVVVYQERRSDGLVTGAEVLAVRFQHSGEDYFVFGFKRENAPHASMEYYDEQGAAMQHQFLPVPVQYARYRISSRFQRRRFHPVYKRHMDHLGTDYAAPHGTPIIATADGTVIEAGRTGGNGKWVKIKHNDTYATGYLHMSEILVKRGQRVRQGDIIGRVGSTGVATGPHVCYRFWKSGHQVDPTKLNMPRATPIQPHEKEAFIAQADALRPKLWFDPLDCNEADPDCPLPYAGTDRPLSLPHPATSPGTDGHRLLSQSATPQGEF